MNTIKEYISIIGAGSFGSAMAIVLAKSSPNHNILLWARREEIANEINQSRTNKQYLPKNSKEFPDNISATTNINTAISKSKIIFIAIPGEYILETLKDVNLNYKTVVSLVKSIRVSDKGETETTCQLIKKKFPESKICVLSGPNMYDSLCRGEFAEATIGTDQEEVGITISKLFNPIIFRTNVTKDRLGVELCGVLKNIIALGCGFIDAYSYSNARATLIRYGLHEMYRLSQKILPTVLFSTFFESSAGIGDLILTTHSGRGILLSKTYAEEYNLNYFKELEIYEKWDLLESRLFNNMKLPDWHTAFHVGKLLEIRGWYLEFPILYIIYEIVWKDVNPRKMIEVLSSIQSPKISQSPRYSLFS
ncbi:MAG: glycerol-3-phosphate dehydrogenase [NAD(P)+] [Paracoccaceae bacterium]|nr:MAG: glycerol-3-phosphate dehydrogenase [NAD(P)+] [Paracoccaceae bacterium]